MTSKKPDIGDEGIALETFALGEKGKVYFKEFGIIDVLAREEIRERSHVIIIDGHLGGREGSPEELKFESYARTWNRVIAGQGLPVQDRGNGTPAYAQAVAAGNNLVHQPAAGLRTRILLIDLFNSGVGAIVVNGIRFGDAGALNFGRTLAANTGVVINLTGCNWEGLANEVVNVDLAAIGVVDVTLMVEDHV